MTLPEVLITVVITGTLVTAMATATMVIINQNDNSEGRVNNARSEASVGVWLPSDLASAEEVDTSPGASPCGSLCPPGVNVSGSNTLMLVWTGWVEGETEPIPTRTAVSYRYVQEGDEWMILRVACYTVGSGAPECEQVVVVHDVDPPPPGIEYYPGITSPTWVMLVTLAVDPASPGDGSDVEDGEDPTYYIKNGRRVTVTINGGGDAAGAGGGTDQITLSAGGTNREGELGTDVVSATPTFAATRSRCGGNFGLLVDTSGSIGSNMSSVRTGLTAFVNAFAGTPVKLQVVRFSTTSSTLSPGGEWTYYYDMLDDDDVDELLDAISGLSATGGTNYEDGFFRMFRNSDGSVQQVLPSTLIFFTDGMPTYNRLNASSASAPATMHPDDNGLPAGTGSSYNQMSWNRADRIIRQFEVDLEKFVGVYVGTDVNGQSLWREQGAGYHLTNFVRGYHYDYERGYHLTNFERGSHQEYQYATSGMTYQRAQSGLTYQYATTGVVFQRFRNGSWESTSASSFFSNNSNNTESDGRRILVTGTPGGWTTISGGKSTYDKANVFAGEGDGIRVTASSPSSWTNTTKDYFDLNNTTSNQNDGYRIQVSSPGGWSETTEAYYNLNNTTGDSSDGFRISTEYNAPFTNWETTTESLYLGGNTVDGDSDGWRATQNFAAPFNYWAAVTESAYNGGNTTADASDGWRTVNNYTSPYTLWEGTSESTYLANNSSWGSGDGWDATKVYEEPYDYHEGATSYNRYNRDILKDLVAPGGVVPAEPAGGPYTNAAAATYYQLPVWSQFSGAMTSMALAECGGTVTVQTRIGGVPAADPFTYQNSVDLTTATTSQQFRSGTFDYDLAGGASVDAEITQLNLSSNNKYAPVSWTCTSGGTSYPFTATPIDGGPWQKISLTISPNQAISCVQTVRLL